MADLGIVEDIASKAEAISRDAYRSRSSLGQNCKPGELEALSNSLNEIQEKIGIISCRVSGRGGGGAIK
jgi:hypothetical protein